MGRSPCCYGEASVKKGPWTPEEDKLLVDYIQDKGHGSWCRLPKLAGLNRSGMSCRIRWMNSLHRDIKHGRFTDDEEKLIIHLHSLIGNKWSSIATKLPGRTDNEIKNYWNTQQRKKLLGMGIDPVTHRPCTDLSLLDGLPGLLAVDGSWNFELLSRSSLNSGCTMDFADLDEREGDYTPRLVYSSWIERINKLLMASAKISAYHEENRPHTLWRERINKIRYSQMPPYKLNEATKYTVPYGQTMWDKLAANHEKNRVRQPLPVMSIVPSGGLGKRALTRHVYRDFDSDRMFQNTDSKTLLRSIVNRVSEQPLNASLASYQSIKRKIKDTIDFVLGIDKQKAIRKKGIDMDILWCIVDALAKECNRAKFSDGPNIRPTFSSMLCAKTRSRYMHTRTGNEGVNFSVTKSSLHKGADASVRMRWHRIPEVDTSFCSPPWVFDSGASFCWICMGGWNPLLDLHQVDPVSVANGPSILALSKLVLLVDDSIKTEMKNTRHRLRKSRHNKGRRLVTRRTLARKTRYHKRGDTRAASQKNRGLVSRSEPISADNSSLLTPDSTPEQAWRVASAAPQHMTGYLNHLTDYTPASGDQVIDTPTMGPMVFQGSGLVNTTNMTLRDVLYVPGLDANLVSTGQLAEHGYTIAIGPYGCRVYKDDEGMALVGKAHYVDGYLLELDFLRVRASTN